MVLDAMRRLADAAMAQGQFDRASYFARNQIALDPWQEGAHRQLITALAQQGQRRLALKQYEGLVRLLEEEVGVPPEPQTIALYDALMAQPPGAPAPALRFSPTPTRHNLPPYYTPFFGRTAELALLTTALRDPHRRLVAVVGEGGMGKSRLAVEVAGQLLANYPDGVWFVSLAADENGVLEEGEVVGAIGNVLALTLMDNADPKSQLLNYLRMKRCLLVLDNFESADPAQPLLLELLAAAPSVSLLITSRHQLALQAVYTLTIEGLGLPTDLNEARSTPGLQLFSERAERTAAGWQLREEELGDAVGLCELVHGMPLGIELAAAWAANAGVATVRRQLHRNLEELAVGYHDMPSRHRSLRALFTASWQLLACDEQTVLSAITVFRERFSEEAAAAVTGATSAILTALVRKSLVRQAAEGQYRLHREIRHFAAEYLEAGSPFARRHSDYYLAWVAPFDAQLFGASTPWAVREIREVWANVRSAWRWAAANHVWEGLALSHRAVKRYIDLTEQLRDGFVLMEEAGAPLLTSPGAIPDAAACFYGLFLVQAAHFAVLIGETERVQPFLAAVWDTAETHSTEPLGVELKIRYFLVQAQLAQQHGEYPQALEWAEQAEPFLPHALLPALVPVVLMRLAQLLTVLQKFEAARRHLEQALVLTRENGDLESEARVLQNIGTLHFFQQDMEGGRRYNLASLDLLMVLHDEVRVWSQLGNIGSTYLYEFAYETAYEYYQRAVEGVVQVGFVEGMATMVLNRGRACRYLGLTEQAASDFATALGWYTQTGGLWGQCVSTGYLAWLAAQRGDHAQAQNLIQAAVATARIINFPQGYYFVLTFLGFISLKSGEWEGAEAAFAEVVMWCDRIGDPQCRLDALAGLAEAAFARQDRERAVERVNEVLAGIEAGQLTRAEEPIGVYNRCIRILRAVRDRRAPHLVRVARALLAKQAAMIGDPTFREAFMQREAHRQVTVNS